MAIIPAVPGLSAGIIVNGIAVQEYDDKECPVDAKTTAKFVEATSGAEFEVFYNFYEPFPTDRPVSVKVTVDGKLIDEPLILAQYFRDERGHVCSGAVSNSGGAAGWVEQKFVFADLDIDPDNDANTITTTLLRELENVGTVTLQFYFLKPSVRPNRNAAIRPKALQAKEDIPEKTVKGDAISHQATFKAAEATADVDVYDADYAVKDRDGKEIPFATFHFHYRSVPALEALWVIRRTPEIHHLDEVDIDEMPEDELRKLVKRTLEKSKPKTRVKRERSEYDSGLGSSSNPEVDEDEVLFLQVKRLKHGENRLPQEGDTVLELDD